MSLLLKAAKRHGTEKKSFKFEMKIHKVLLFQQNTKLYLRVVWTRGKRLVATKWCEGFNEFQMEENLFHIATMYMERNNNSTSQSNGIQPKSSELMLEIRDKIDGKNVKYAKIELNLATFVDLLFPSKLTSQKLLFEKSKTQQAYISFSMKATESNEIINDQNDHNESFQSPSNRHIKQSKSDETEKKSSRTNNDKSFHGHSTYNENENIISQSYQPSNSLIHTRNSAIVTHIDNNKKNDSRVVQSLNSATTSSVLLINENRSHESDDFDAIYSDLKLLSTSQKKSPRKSEDIKSRTNLASDAPKNNIKKNKSSMSMDMSENVDNKSEDHKNEIENNEDKKQSKNREHNMKTNKRSRSYSTNILEKPKKYKIRMDSFNKIENNIVEQENENSDCDQFENFDDEKTSKQESAFDSTIPDRDEKKINQSDFAIDNNQNSIIDHNNHKKENENINNNENSNHTDENKSEMKSGNVHATVVNDHNEKNNGENIKNEEAKMKLEEDNIDLESDDSVQEKTKNRSSQQILQVTANINKGVINDNSNFDMNHLVNLDIHSKNPIDEKNKEINDLKEEINKLQKNIDDLNKAADAKQKEYKTQIESLQAERLIYERKMLESKENVEKMHDKVDKMEFQTKSMMDERSNKINKLENEMQETSNKCEKLLNENKEIKMRNESLEKQIEDKNNTIRSLFQSNDSNESLIKTLNEEIAKYKKKIDLISKRNQKVTSKKRNSSGDHDSSLQYNIDNENNNNTKKIPNSPSLVSISSSDGSNDKDVLTPLNGKNGNNENNHMNNDEIIHEEKIIENGEELLSSNKEANELNSIASASKRQRNDNVVNNSNTGDEIKENVDDYNKLNTDHNDDKKNNGSNNEDNEALSDLSDTVSITSHFTNVTMKTENVNELFTQLNNQTNKNNPQLTKTQIRELVKQAQRAKAMQNLQKQNQQLGFSNEISKLLLEAQNKQINDNGSSVQKLQTEWINAETEKMKLQQALKLEKTQNVKKQMEYDKLLSKCNKIESDANKMKQEYNETKIKFEKLEDIHIKLKFDFTNMTDRINTLEFENNKLKNLNDTSIHHNNTNNHN